MSDKQVADDLAEDPDFSLLCHFDKPDTMRRLEELFAKTLNTLGLSKEELKSQAEFNLDVFNIRNFESLRAVFRFANALAEEYGFTKLEFLRGKGLADLTAVKDGQRWFIEVKTLTLQTKPREVPVNGVTEILYVDVFQPATNSVADYVEAVTKKIAGTHIEKARQQLIDTVKKLGEGKKMIGLVVNLLAGDFFEAGNLAEVYAKLSGKSHGWEKNYLADVDVLAFLTNKVYLLSSS